jgi:general nucleoside transport system permease protein
MTSVAVAEVAESTTARGFWTRSRRAGTAYLLLGLIAASVFGALAASVDARFTLTEDAEGLSLDIPGRAGAMAFGVICAAVGVALLAGLGKQHFGWTTAVAIVSFVLSFLCWQISAAKSGGHFMPLVDIARGSLFLAMPLILGALSGVLCERSGVININIEGQFLMGAFAGALVGTVAASTWAGLVAAGLAGCLLAAVLAVLAIRYLVDQVVLGVVLNLLALGITGFLYERLMQVHQEEFNSPPVFHTWKIPLLSEIPVLGPAVFDANVFVYLALVLVAVIHVALFQTRWGLRVRAVGEHPTAADTVGVRVRLVRYRNVLLGGLIAGVGGAFFTLGTIGAFTKNMTAGKGFIALAALIFGRWSPTGALLAALLFGFADKLQNYLSLIGSPIPSSFLVMLPYLATILAVAGLVGRVRAPAADGKPYVKG